MSFRTLFNSLKSRPSGSTARATPLWSKAARLHLEALDDRTMPSTFTVTNLLDAGTGSLRAAVTAANANPGADTIDFGVTGSIGLTSGQLDITDSVTINGPGAGALTVSGERLSRVFAIAGNPTVVMADLTVANGYTYFSPGGGISIAGGTVTLDHVTVTGNTAECWLDYNYTRGVAAGGGISVEGGTLTLDQCTVSGNEALGAQGLVEYYVDDYGFTYSFGHPGGEARGGGLFVAAGVVYVNQSTISLNGACGGAGGDAWGSSSPPKGGDAFGGGILVDGDGTLEVRQSTVFGNRAVGGRSGWVDDPAFAGVSAGGGLSLANGYPIAFLDTFTVSNTINNSADFGPNILGPYSLDGLPRLTIGDVTAREGNGGTTAFVFAVTRSGPIGQAVSVEYTIADGTATAGSDYQATSATLTIPAGQTTGTITVQVIGDRLVELNKSFFVMLSNPINATVADGSGTGTIVDDEPRISITNVSKIEGKNNQATQFTFTVTLSAAYDQPVTMSYRTADGTATTGDRDYVAKSGTLTFAPGETTKTITIVVTGDRKREAGESFYLDLFGNSGNSWFNKNRGIGWIQNDD